ncbi:hypothetical protein GCM10009846_17740 [Agrococcus versicolor]|uniref:Uncharacterized protein n=1 Tax=Agrococcus versicolor TaxID=501482 RepID=A0ABN3ARZ7_9MICO
MTGQERDDDAERLFVVLEGLRTAPTPSLRWERRDLLSRGVAVDPAVRRVLAEHYRRIHAPDQAARWGWGTPDWTRASEGRALRLVLLDLLPFAEPRALLWMAREESAPRGLEDLVDLDPLPRDSWVMGVGCITTGICALLLVAGVLGVGGGTLIRIVTGDAADEVLRYLGMGSLAMLVTLVVGLVALAVSDRSARRLERKRVAAVRARVESLLPGLSRKEQAVLLRSWLRSFSDTDEQRPVRLQLVDLARRRRRAAEAGRWGVAVAGLTTEHERQAFAATLRAGDEWLFELERRTSRTPGALGVDECDALLRAGIPPEVLEADEERRRSLDAKSSVSSRS